MDYWVSYVAHFCDIYFRASFDIIKEHDYLNKIIDRIPYSNPDTKNKMETYRSTLQSLSIMLTGVKNLTKNHSHCGADSGGKDCRSYDFRRIPHFHISPDKRSYSQESAAGKKH